MKIIVRCLVISSILAAPAHADGRDALFQSSAEPSATRTSMFAGATYRVGFDRRAGKAKGRAALSFGSMALSPTTASVRFSDSFQLTGGRTGKPALHIAGQDIGELGRTTQLNGTTTAVLVVGGLALLLVGAVALSRIESHRCIGEEGDCD